MIIMSGELVFNYPCYFKVTVYNQIRVEIGMRKGCILILTLYHLHQKMPNYIYIYIWSMIGMQ